MIESKTFASRIANVIIYTILASAVFLALAPIVNTIAISFSSASVAASGRVSFLPIRYTTDAYIKIMKDHKFWHAFGVSVWRVIVGGGMSMVLTILMSFPLSRKESQFKWRNYYMWFLIFAMLFNGGMIPTYMIVSKLHLINSYWALVLPGAVNIGNVILMMNFFKGIPASLEEAAVIDGAGPMTILLKVFLPISLPSLATITLFTIVGCWNEFFSGMIYMNNSDKFPLQTYLQSLNYQIQNISQMSREELLALQKVSSLTLNAAKILVSTIPILIIYPIMQRFLVSGLVLGAVKE